MLQLTQHRTDNGKEVMAVALNLHKEKFEYENVSLQSSLARAKLLWTKYLYTSKHS